MIDQEIVKFLISWINENTIYEKFLLNLEIVVLDLEELQLLACRGKCPILAFFSAPNIIYIAKLDFNDLCNQSILLHEMIHVEQYCRCKKADHGRWFKSRARELTILTKEKYGVIR